MILVTLVVQGFTFGAAIRLLGWKDDGLNREEETQARRLSFEAGLAYLETLGKNSDASAEHIQDLRDRHARRRHCLMVKDQPVLFHEKREVQSVGRRLRLSMLRAEHHALIRPRDEDKISDSVMLLIHRDLDLEVTLLEQDEQAGWPTSRRASRAPSSPSSPT